MLAQCYFHIGPVSANIKPALGHGRIFAGMVLGCQLIKNDVE